MFVVACVLIVFGLYLAYVLFRMYTGFRKLDKERDVKKSEKKHVEDVPSVTPNQTCEEDVLKKYCTNDRYTNNCGKCIANKQMYARKARCNTEIIRNWCLEPNSQEAKTFCESNKNATYEICKKINESDTYCKSNSKGIVDSECPEYDPCKGRSDIEGPCETLTVDGYDWTCEKFNGKYTDKGTVEYYPCKLSEDSNSPCVKGSDIPCDKDDKIMNWNDYCLGYSVKGHDPFDTESDREKTIKLCIEHQAHNFCSSRAYSYTSERWSGYKLRRLVEVL